MVDAKNFAFSSFKLVARSLCLAHTLILGSCYRLRRLVLERSQLRRRCSRSPNPHTGDTSSFYFYGAVRSRRQSLFSYSAASPNLGEALNAKFAVPRAFE